jgi:PAS domain S-box-containing protein
MPEQQLQRVEAHLHLLMESVREYAILTLDPEGRILSWNAGAERLLGFHESEIVGEHFGRLFTPEDVQNGVPERELCVARETGQSKEDHWLIRKDGTRFWASDAVTPLRDGKLHGYAKVIHDLTEQKEAHDALRASEERHRKLAEELQEIDKRKDKFLAMLSHELRNPLAPMLTAVQILGQYEGNEIQLHARAIIERQVRHMARMVEDLLEVSRMTTGKMTLHKEPCELKEVVERAVESARPLIDARQHQLSVTVPEGPCVADADSTRLEQAVVNLLANSAKFTPQSGNIMLTLDCNCNNAHLRVWDNGIGIEPEILPHVFEFFAQGDQGPDRSPGGLGIGLALVKAVVELHDGSVEARSAGKDRGSEFILRLPLTNGNGHRPSDF